MRAVIFDVRRELREKEPMLVRMAHEAKVGRLLRAVRVWRSWRRRIF